MQITNIEQLRQEIKALFNLLAYEEQKLVISLMETKIAERNSRTAEVV